MPSITIRDVPEATRDELAARAARSGRSLQEFLRMALITLGDQPDPESWVDRVRARKSATTSRVTAEQILAYRDADRH